MDSVPETPGQQTRTAVTRRIIAHVRRGWPRLGEPIVRHRGRFCYVSALLPGHREPTPILRLRYQGSADRWAIGIYLASSGQYTESELPASFGPTTGTPEEGIDDTFILYAGPKTGHLRPSARTRAQATKVRNTSDLGSRVIGKHYQIDILRFGAPAGQRLLHPIEGMCYQTFHGTEKPLRYDRMSGLDPEQLDELVWRIEEQLEEPWHKGIGRPKDLSLREAVVVASGYMRQNIIQEVWAEIFDTSQPVISGIIAKFTPLIEASTEEDRPTAEEAEEAVAREQTVLVDGFLAPTWSWRDTPELWSGKHKTTGFNGQAIANLRGDLLFVSEPVTGHNHDMTALAETETADVMAAAFSGIGDKGYQGSDFITPFKKPQGGELLDWQKEFNAQVNRLRAPVERAIAHLKSWRILHTDYRRPLRTYVTSYRAAVGLYFFKLNFG